MYFDIVFPEGNEAEFISMAEQLGYSGLCFLYKNARNSQQPKTKPDICYGYVNQDKNKKSKPAYGLYVSLNPDNPRHIIEQKLADVVFSLEQNQGHDFIHQRNSGFNHILAKLAEKNNIAVGFSLSLLLPEKSRPKIMGRMMQNIMLCKKYNVPVVVASLAKSPFQMRAPKELISLFSELGLGHKKAKEAMQHIQKINLFKKKVQQGKAFGRNVEVID